MTIPPTTNAHAQLPGLAPLYRTDLHIPPYRLGEHGRWRLIKGGLTLDRGFFSGPCSCQGNVALLRENPESGALETWMSLSPYEMESQEIAVRAAFGHVAVMGFGMGWAAANIALHPKVTRVTVVERDTDVIALNRDIGSFDGLDEAARAKLHIVNADAMAWSPAEGEPPVDFLYPDIWLTMAEEGTLEQTQAMQANLNARKVYIWGQEVLLIRALTARHGQLPNPLTYDHLEEAAAGDLALPLLLPRQVDYPKLIEVVARSRAALGKA